MKKLILATTSIPRKEAFNELNIQYETRKSNVEEYSKDRPNAPQKLVQYLARLKAEAVAKENLDAIVVGFDSVAYFKGEILEKPKSKEEAFERLKIFSGNSYYFFTGVHLIEGEFTNSKIIETKVYMRTLKETEIKKYLAQDKNFKRYAQGFDPLNTFGV